MPKVFVSDTIGQERLIFGPQGPADHTGWKLLSVLYASSLAACGYKVEGVIRPEIYQAKQARQVLSVEEGDWHLACKPVEHIRPFHGIANVFVCDWPYPELSSSSHGVSPFFDQVRLLKQASAVFCCTDFTTQALRNAGVRQAVTLPPCIPSPAGVALTDRLAGRQNFLLLADATSLCHQLVRTVEGFVQAHAHRSDLHLTVCSRDAASLGHSLLELVGRGPLENVVSFVEMPAEWTTLLGAADFFLCDSEASGLNMPMVQAMLADIPLVTTLHSGMGSVLTSEASVQISTRPAAVNGEIESIARHMSLTCNQALIEGVRDAVLTAAGLDPSARAHMVHLAGRIAEAGFGLVAFKACLAEVSGTFL